MASVITHSIIRSPGTSHLEPGGFINHIHVNSLQLLISNFLTLISSRTVPRENDQFSRHINLQLTYSFQQNPSHTSLQQLGSGAINNNNNTSLNNNNITSKTSLYHGKMRRSSCVFDGISRLMDSSLPAESSMDELSEDSAIHCMQNEV